MLFKAGYTLNTIKEAAKALWQQAGAYRIWVFSGEMGAGKTTFIHTLCNEAGVKDAVSSPTFALINEYHFTNNDGNDQLIHHMDWYRLRNDEEAISAGMEDTLLQKNAYCFIEWPEKALSLIPKPHIWINIRVTGEFEREMEVSLKS